MTGWKSKWGAITTAIGSGLLAASMVTVPFATTTVALQAAGVFLTGIGASLLGVGIAHKIEKTGE